MLNEDNSSTELNDAIKKHVLNYLLKAALVIFPIGMTIVPGLVYFLAGGAAEDAVKSEISDLKVNDKLQEILVEYGTMKEKVHAAQNELNELENQIGPIVEKTKNISYILDQITAEDLQNISSLPSEGENVNNLSYSSNIGDFRIFLGKTCAEHNPWRACEPRVCEKHTNKAGVLDVSIAEANFTEAPVIFISQSGTGSWTTQGVHAVYRVEPTSFRLYAYGTHPEDKTYADYANYYNHCVHWLALGR